MSVDNKILVVGATGNNGKELVSQLKDAGLPVRAMVRNLEKNKALASDTTELVQGDLTDQESLDAAMEGINIAYIVTAIHEDAVSYYANFIAAAKRAGVKGVIKISAIGASTDSASAILRQHGESDDLLIASGLDYAILRPNSFFQNMFWEARQIKRRSKFSLPMADAKQSIVDIRDIAEATVALCKKGTLDNSIHTLTGPESISYIDVAQSLSEKLDKPVKYVPGSAEASEQGMKAMGMPEWNAVALTELQKMFANGDFADVSADLATLLGRQPRSFADFASDYVKYF